MYRAWRSHRETTGATYLCLPTRLCGTIPMRRTPPASAHYEATAALHKGRKKCCPADTLAGRAKRAREARLTGREAGAPRKKEESATAVPGRIYHKKKIVGNFKNCDSLASDKSRLVVRERGSSPVSYSLSCLSFLSWRGTLSPLLSLRVVCVWRGPL